MFFQFKYLFGNIKKYFSGICQNHLFAKTIHEPDIIILLQALDTLGHSRLRYEEILGGFAEVAAFGGHVKDFELVQIHEK
jgi:hypothetical protein